MSWTAGKKQEYLTQATIILNKCGDIHGELANALRMLIKTKKGELKIM
jgi:hypothetical protein